MVFSGLVILQSALSHAHTKLIRFGLFVVYALSVYMVFFSFSRGSWLGLVFVLSGLFLIYPKFTFRFGAITSFVILIVLGSGLLDPHIDFAQQRFYSDNSEETALSRLPVIYGSIRMFQAKPIFGWGYENFDRFDYQFQGRVGELVTPEKDHASHNVYLTILAEQGILGISFYLLPVLWWLVATIKVFPKMPQDGFWSRKLLLFFWLVAIFNIVVNNFSNMRIEFGLGLWWVNLSFIATMIESYRSPVKNSKSVYVPLQTSVDPATRFYKMPDGKQAEPVRRKPPKSIIQEG
jgi:O-antigen ligase